MDKAPRPSLLSITKKIIMALTGLGLCIFLVGHLIGNSLLIFNLGWFNTYARTLNAIPILLLIELGLLAMFLLHAWEGFAIWKENKNARPIDYQGGKHWAREKSTKSHKSTSSTTMMWTGFVILFFVALHVWHFKYHHSIGPENPIAAQKAGQSAPAVGVAGIGVTPNQEQSSTQSAQEAYDLALHVVYEFKKPYVSILYMACMIALGLHLNHAVWSAFQTLGATDSKLRKFMIGFGRVFTILVAGGFFLLPVYAWFFIEVTK